MIAGVLEQSKSAREILFGDCRPTSFSTESLGSFIGDKVLSSKSPCNITITPKRGGRRRAPVTNLTFNPLVFGRHPSIHAREIFECTSNTPAHYTNLNVFSRVLFNNNRSARIALATIFSRVLGTHHIFTYSVIVTGIVSTKCKPKEGLSTNCSTALFAFRVRNGDHFSFHQLICQRLNTIRRVCVTPSHHCDCITGRHDIRAHFDKSHFFIRITFEDQNHVIVVCRGRVIIWMRNLCIYHHLISIVGVSQTMTTNDSLVPLYSLHILHAMRRGEHYIWCEE
mmetsp:Transcript_25377/g.54567  ORF Transcript_25377/g.54567 Transcript_25377/m.54567 type:complete len:282 (+) Transcript_25377:478-1323(+)